MPNRSTTTAPRSRKLGRLPDLPAADSQIDRQGSDHVDMALIDRVRDFLIGPHPYSGSNAIASPLIHRPNHLETVDGLGDWYRDYRSTILTRDVAIRVAPLARARGLIVSTIARLPIVARDATGDSVDTPQFVTDTSGPLSPFHRMLWTIDDLFFHGWSLWAVARDATGAVVTADRVDWHRWHIDDQGTVVVDDAPAADRDVVLIPGVNEGILTYGADTLIQAARLSASATRAAENPAAQVELHQTTDAPLTDEQIDALIARWARARRGENGGVAYTSAAVEVREHGASSEHLLIDGRNASAVDIARHAGIPATMIDATLSGSSLSYQNTTARLIELLTFGLSPLMAAVAGRLSQDDVTPPGVTLAFDTETVIDEIARWGVDDDTDLPERTPDDEKLGNSRA